MLCNKPITVCGTPLTPTSYDEILAWILNPQVKNTPSVLVDLTNTYIVTLRHDDPKFHQATSTHDLFIPDSTPLVWCLNALTGKKTMNGHVYGPELLKRAMATTTNTVSHYLIGGTQACNQALLTNCEKNPQWQSAGTHHGFFPPHDYDKMAQEIANTNPDIVWVGLGTPRQHQFSAILKKRLRRGIILNVGYAFDVNANTKKDAPHWMRRAGLVWLYRLASEPLRLGPRYLKHNSRFLILAIQQILQKKLAGNKQKH